MNGNTWARYRLALPPEPGDPAHAHPYFAGEPINPPEYPEHFRTAGFEVVARYESRADDHPGAASPAAEELGRRVEEAGVSVRTLDPARFDDEIRAIFELSLAGFAGNLYYSPIDFDTFRAMYERVREILDRELILLAQGRDGKPLSFFYAFPDPWSAEGGRPTRVVAKSMATLPEARGLGLGRHLFDLIRRRAHEKGYRSVLHALMHVDNVSRSLSERHASRLFRRYALYQWKP
jgi:GNAT superfamily N-acetyltransferase